MYSWFRTEPLEVAYQKATEQAFVMIADDLAEQHGPVLAQLDLPTSETLASTDGSKSALRAAIPASSANLRPLSERPVIAIFKVQAPSRSFEADILSQLTEYITVRLAELGAYRIIPQQQLKQEFDTQKKSSYDACYDESCQIELGKAVAAEKLMTPKLLKFGKKCALSAAVYDLRTETTDHSASVRTDCAIDTLIDAADQLIVKLAS
jgi:hypothetical protein